MIPGYRVLGNLPITAIFKIGQHSESDLCFRYIRTDVYTKNLDCFVEGRGFDTYHVDVDIADMIDNPFYERVNHGTCTPIISMGLSGI